MTSRRVKKTTYQWLADQWFLLAEYDFVYDGWNLICEQTTVPGAPMTREYIWGLDLSGTLQGAGGIGGLLATINNLTAKTYLYTFDANGDVVQLVDAADGTIAAHYEYDPFGNLLVTTGPEAENNPFRFSMKYFDAEVGLYYYGYRYYSPEMGRWLRRDPIEEKGGLNLYGFVQNDGSLIFPVIRSDNARLCHPATRSASRTSGLWFGSLDASPTTGRQRRALSLLMRFSSGSRGISKNQNDSINAVDKDGRGKWCGLVWASAIAPALTFQDPFTTFDPTENPGDVYVAKLADIGCAINQALETYMNRFKKYQYDPMSNGFKALHCYANCLIAKKFQGKREIFRTLMDANLSYELCTK